MIALRGDADIRPAMTGKSTQNTRVERFWGIYNTKVNDRFRVLFHEMEDRGVLTNHLDDPAEWAIDRYCLTRIFLARIQTAADNLAASWDYHKLSTEGNKSPLRLWLDGWQASEVTSQEFTEHSSDNYGSEFNPTEGDEDDLENPEQVVIGAVVAPPLDEAWLEATAVACGADIGTDQEAVIAYERLRALVCEALVGLQDVL
jgi:hypothetical protein